jgi:hypothetical protein
MPNPGIPNKFAISKAAAAAGVVKKLASRFGVDPADLPAEVKKLANDAVDARFTSVSRRAVAGYASQELRTGDLSTVVDDIRQFQDQFKNTKLNEALKSNAEMMFKTYKSFVDAGFSDTQAFELILSQVQR